MTDPDPIACSLDRGGLDVRLAAVSQLGRDALISHRVDGGRHLLRFGGTPDVRDRLERIVRAERRCCPFLTLELAGDDREIMLRIEAPPGAEPVAAGLAAAFAGAPA